MNIVGVYPHGQTFMKRALIHRSVQAISYKSILQNLFHSNIHRIFKGLKDHTVLSRKQIDILLWSKLPIDYTDEQKNVKIKNLLAKMRKQHIIKVGEDRLWHLCSV